MENAIFYYTSTGNSLVAAREIARGLPECALIDMTRAHVTEALVGSLARVGFVFPVHAWGVPVIVQDFLEGLSLPQPKYLFAVLTGAGNPGNALHLFRDLLTAKGLRLDAGYEIEMPTDFILEVDPPEGERMRKILEASEASIPKILSAVQAYAISFPESTADRAALSTRFHPGWKELVHDLGPCFHVAESCTGCGICARVCPSANISLDGDHRPHWADRCTCCMACIQWCPHRSIEMELVTPEFVGRTVGRRQYHHPLIKASDVFSRKDST